MIVIVTFLPQGIVPALAQWRPRLGAKPRDEVAVHIGGLVALAAMSFAVREHEIVSLIGPNGAGKTTAFNVITGYMRPTAGSVRYRGRQLVGLTPPRIAAAGV